MVNQKPNLLSLSFLNLYFEHRLIEFKRSDYAAILPKPEKGLELVKNEMK